MLLHWKLKPDRSYKVLLRLLQKGQLLDENLYDDPFHPLARPKGYPWRFDPVLGMRCYGGRYAQSPFRALNTWYGKIASWLLPVYKWVEETLVHESNPRLDALLRKLFG
jgi:hypothetical protein